MTAAIGMCFDRTFPPALVTEFARRLEEGGADELWVIEDCFYTAGVSLAAAALTATGRLRVGIGILPAVARNPAITAMEIATLCGLAPGRLLPGIGHGVQSWMGQMGARTPSPLTTLREVLEAVRRLLAGERVTVRGKYVTLDEVRLDQPPAEAPPVYAGVRGPKSLAVAGQAADGVVLADAVSPAYVRWALERAGSPDGFRVAVLATLCVAADRAEAYRRAAPWLSDQLAESHVSLRQVPFFDELVALHEKSGLDGLVTMPPDWWAELGPIGTIDDAAGHLDALEAAGATNIALFPAPDLEIARGQVDQVLRLAQR